MYEVIFYEKENGEKPVEVFLDSLDIKMRAKTLHMLEILAEKGNDLRMPYSRYLSAGIFELRITQGNNISRVLYFFYKNKQIIVTNGFVKKQQKMPISEIKLAKSRKKDFLKQQRRRNEI